MWTSRRCHRGDSCGFPCFGDAPDLDFGGVDACHDYTDPVSFVLAPSDQRKSSTAPNCMTCHSGHRQKIPNAEVSIALQDGTRKQGAIEAFKIRIHRLDAKREAAHVQRL
ncbi:hypothetical protein GCM10023194_05570 [Planotetraspora phitsanulokensis]|uniref:Uncharacterized protein n=1 Tax=Planotetraspora phitsanulokensis TaxID=575192 RepID=A0A8J3U5Q0_9ACTN|nr:hypothetical protein Pph01_40560 [Planotetraspora phitsanulokensis]